MSYVIVDFQAIFFKISFTLEVASMQKLENFDKNLEKIYFSSKIPKIVRLLQKWIKFKKNWETIWISLKVLKTAKDRCES